MRKLSGSRLAVNIYEFQDLNVVLQLRIIIEELDVILKIHH